MAADPSKTTATAAPRHLGVSVVIEYCAASQTSQAPAYTRAWIVILYKTIFSNIIISFILKFHLLLFNYAMNDEDVENNHEEGLYSRNDSTNTMNDEDENEW